MALPSMIFQNARLIFPDAIRDGLEVVVRHGKIVEIRDQSGPSDDQIVDLAGNYLAPGFIDLHVHGAVGRDTMEGSAEAFGAICDYHASGGTTSLLLTTATAPLRVIVDVIRRVGESRAAVRQVAGVHVEGPFISKVRAGVQRNEFIQDPDTKAVEQLLHQAEMIKRITIAPELPGALNAIKEFHTREISVSGGHSDAWDEEARAAFAAGMRSVTHTFNCMSSARKRGPYRVAGLLEYAMGETGVVCELIADGHHVSGTLMRLLYRAKGPKGICLVTDAIAGAGLPEGTQFSLYGLECVVGSGVGLQANQLALAGSVSRMVDLVRTMVKNVDVPLHEAIAMATANPARLIGLEAKGRLQVGTDADFVVLSPWLQVLETFLAGEKIFAQRRSGGF
jgi:N-acetylglucosamine-6-phosphate deacetylase